METASYILADANLERETIAWLLSFSKTASIPFIIEPVSVPPASKLAQMDLQGLYLITPNEDELPAICSTHAKSLTQQINELLNRGVQQVWLHNGARGSTLFSRSKQVSLHACAIEVADCTGAGDGSLTGFLLGKHLGREDEACLRIAHTLAAEILKVKGAIAYHLDREKLQQLVPVYYPG